MILTVFADESIATTKDKRFEVMSIGAFVGTKDQWETLSGDWKSVLHNYNVSNFHLKDFHHKDNFSNSESPYYSWDDEKREEFFYDLAQAVGHNLVPVGGANATPIGLDLPKDDSTRHLFSTFFRALSGALDRHWPDLNGENGDRVKIVYDNTKKRWREIFHQVHDEVKNKDSRFGGLDFEDDTDHAYLGLQAADFIAGIYRQSAERNFAEGKQHLRIIDFILFRNIWPAEGPFNISEIPPKLFRAMVEEYRKDQKRHKIKASEYFPADHIECIIGPIQNRAPELAYEVYQWVIQKQIHSRSLDGPK